MLSGSFPSNLGVSVCINVRSKQTKPPTCQCLEISISSITKILKKTFQQLFQLFHFCNFTESKHASHFYRYLKWEGYGECLFGVKTSQTATDLCTYRPIPAQTWNIISDSYSDPSVIVQEKTNRHIQPLLQQ